VKIVGQRSAESRAISPGTPQTWQGGLGWTQLRK
jgi:hypothetical protein